MKRRRKNVFDFGIGIVFSIFVVTILISSAIAVPVFHIDNNPEIKTNDEKKLDVFIHPEYYDINIWKLQPTSYEEEIKRVSYEEAMEIKVAYEHIESNTDDLIEKTKQKNAILRDYGVLSSDDTFENYEKEFNEWKKTQNMDELWQIVDIFLKIFEVLDWEQEGCIVLFGLIAGYLHGPFDGVCIGIPIPYTAFLAHGLYGQGPAEAASRNIFGFILQILLGLHYFVEETTADVGLNIALGFGYISYLPFLLNKNNEGQFDFLVFCLAGGMVEDPLNPF